MRPTLRVREATGWPPAPRRGRADGRRPARCGGTPRQGRACAQATGQLAQTEALDARALAPCADAMRPTPRLVADAQTEDRRALLARRRQLIALRTAEQNRHGRAPPRLHADIAAPITWLNTRLTGLADDLDTCWPAWSGASERTSSAVSLVAVRCVQDARTRCASARALEPPAPGGAGRLPRL